MEKKEDKEILRPEMEKVDKNAALLLQEKEPIPITSAKQTVYFVHDAGRSQIIEASVAPFASPAKKEQAEREGERKSIWKRVSGSGVCKVTVIVYLLSCVLVSALYVALYGGKSQEMFAASDAWIPGKVGYQSKCNISCYTIGMYQFQYSSYQEMSGWVDHR